MTQKFNGAVSLRFLTQDKRPAGSNYFYTAHNIGMQYEKVYVGMFLYMAPDGNVKPAELEWTNGVRYSISKVIDKRIAPPAHVGSSPTLRYTVLIEGREKVVYYEKFSKRWFVEKPV